MLFACRYFNIRSARHVPNLHFEHYVQCNFTSGPNSIMHFSSFSKDVVYFDSSCLCFTPQGSEDPAQSIYHVVKCNRLVLPASLECLLSLPTDLYWKPRVKVLVKLCIFKQMRQSLFSKEWSDVKCFVILI